MKSWTYEKAGVPHLKGDPGYNREIVKLIKSTHVSGVLGNPTGFSSLFDFKKTGIQDPLIVTSTDGVGTKLEIARLTGRHDTIGIDLVAMCVNDVITTGASPVIFLDYFAAGKFEPKVIRQVLKGVTTGCRQAGCALVGGETAIMPGFYAHNTPGLSAEYDIAGFSVGLVDRKKLITGEKIKKGHVLLGLASSGFHSNGYSLLRKIFSKKELSGEIGKKLLTPTLIYVPHVLKLLKTVPLSGVVNITGGGFYDNIPRVLPKGLGAVILKKSWEMPKIFRTVQSAGKISDHEMMRTFNVGIGMVLILESKAVSKAQRILDQMKTPSWVIGEVVKGSGVEVL